MSSRCLWNVISTALLLLAFNAPVMAKEPITPIEAPALNADQVALGRILFHDRRLSGKGDRSCSSCHDTSSNGAGHSSFDRAADGSLLEFNTPTVFNAALNFRLNWEGGHETLQDQARASITNPRIMGANFDTVLSTLNADSAIAARAQKAFGKPFDEAALLDALAAYEMSLVLTDSPFDQWLAGDTDALTPLQKQGYRRFKEIGCAACHQGRNVGGNLFQRHGIFHPLASPMPKRLRVPSLRTVVDTAPYFHDGSAATLDEAIRSMGWAQLDVVLDDVDVRRLEAFLQSLKGTSTLSGKQP